MTPKRTDYRIPEFAAFHVVDLYIPSNPFHSLANNAAPWLGGSCGTFFTGSTDGRRNFRALPIAVTASYSSGARRDTDAVSSYLLEHVFSSVFMANDLAGIDY